MTRIEELREQKRLIEKEIKELTNADIVCNRAKLKFQHYSTERSDEWIVCMKANASKCRWFPVFYANSKSEAIAEIPKLIDDLNGLYDELKGGNDDA